MQIKPYRFQLLLAISGLLFSGLIYAAFCPKPSQFTKKGNYWVAGKQWKSANPEPQSTKQPVSSQLFTQGKVDIIKLITDNTTLEKQNDLYNVLKAINIHIINPDFKTSPIDAVILKLSNGTAIFGGLVQDVAFLTTDAIFTAIGAAITRFGKKDSQISEVHLMLNNTYNKDKPVLSGCEIQSLLELTNQHDISVCSYNNSGFIERIGLKSCVEKIAENIKAPLVDQSKIKSFQQ